MANTNKNNKTVQLTTCANAVNANFPTTQTWILNGKTYSRSDFVNLLAACTEATKQTAASHQAWLTAAANEHAQYALLTPALGAFKKALESQYGPTSQTLAQYGFEPAKAPVKPVAVKAASAAKATATKNKKKAAVEAVEQAASTGTTAAATPAAVVPAAPKTA